MLGSVVGVFFRNGRGILSNLLWGFDRLSPNLKVCVSLCNNKFSAKKTDDNCKDQHKLCSHTWS